MRTEHIATGDGADPFTPHEVALRPRQVHFEWDAVPLHWIPGDPYGSHVITALNLFLPTAERWFSRLLSDSLEYVRDDPAPFLDQLEWVAGQYDQRVSKATPRNRRRALASGTHALCAAEHFTGVFGHWGLNNSWDDMGVDPTLCDLYRWHAAEEVEHRHVSYNVAKYFGMDYFAQAAAGALVTLVFFGMVFRGMKFLVHADPALPNLGYIRLYWKMRASGKHGSVPRTGYVVRAALRLLRRDYDPVNEGNTAQAVAYLASSPAARALSG